MKITENENFKDAQWLAKEALSMKKKDFASILWSDAMELLKKAYGYESDEG